MSAVARRYNPSALVGNWEEERSRAPPLRRGVPDLGFREYSASAASAFTAPPPGGEYTFPRHQSRCGMLTAETWNEAAYAMGDGGAAALAAAGTRRKKDFSGPHGGRDMSAAEIAAAYTTTAREAMREGSGVSGAAARREAADLSIAAAAALGGPAGGLASVRHDRGKKTLGIAGEKLDTGKDARTNTFAQRSWMYAPDPGLTATLRPPTIRPAPEALSLPGLSGEAFHVSACIPPPPEGTLHGKLAAFQAAGRRTTDVTALADPAGASRRPGRRVFLDDP